MKKILYVVLDGLGDRPVAKLGSRRFAVVRGGRAVGGSFPHRIGGTGEDHVGPTGVLVRSQRAGCEVLFRERHVCQVA